MNIALLAFCGLSNSNDSFQDFSPLGLSTSVKPPDSAIYYAAPSAINSSVYWTRYKANFMDEAPLLMQKIICSCEGLL